MKPSLLKSGGPSPRILPAGLHAKGLSWADGFPLVKNLLPDEDRFGKFTWQKMLQIALGQKKLYIFH